MSEKLKVLGPPGAGRRGIVFNPLGRPRGVPNKITIAVKDALKEALAAAPGGAVAVFRRYMESVHKEERIAFLAAVTKLIPHEIAGSADSPLRIVVENLAVQEAE